MRWSFSFVFVALWLAACSAPQKWAVADPPQVGLKYSDEIDRVCNLIHETKLRETPLDDDDIEVRLWAGMGSITNLRGHILRRRGGVWSGVSILEDGFDAQHRFKYRAEPMRQPEEGWDELWRKLMDHHILTLPDAQEIRCNQIYQDGWTDVFEIRTGNRYRTYSYEMPDARKCPEADDVHAIGAIFDHTYDWGI